MRTSALKRLAGAALTACLAAGALLAGQAATAQAEELRTFRFASTDPRGGDPQQLYWYLPLAKGWYEEAGIDFQPVRMPPSTAYPALSAGQIEGGIYAGSAPLAGARGAPMVAVYHPEESAPWGLLVNTNKIDVPEGLNGARCGSAAGPKTAPDITARTVIKHMGADPTSMIYVVVPGSSTEYLTAMRNGVIDCHPSYTPPMRYILEREGWTFVAGMRDVLPIQGMGLTVNRNRIADEAEHRELVKDVIRQMLRAQDYIRDPANHAEIAEILKASMNNPEELTDEDYLRALKDEVTLYTEGGKVADPDDLLNLMRAGISFGYYDPSEFVVDLEKTGAIEAGMVDYSLVDEVHAETGRNKTQ